MNGRSSATLILIIKWDKLPTHVETHAGPNVISPLWVTLGEILFSFSF